MNALNSSRADCASATSVSRSASAASGPASASTASKSLASASARGEVGPAGAGGAVSPEKPGPVPDGGAAGAPTRGRLSAPKTRASPPPGAAPEFPVGGVGACPSAPGAASPVSAAVSSANSDCSPAGGPPAPAAAPPSGVLAGSGPVPAVVAIDADARGFKTGVPRARFPFHEKQAPGQPASPGNRPDFNRLALDREPPDRQRRPPGQDLPGRPRAGCAGGAVRLQPRRPLALDPIRMLVC